MGAVVFPGGAGETGSYAGKVDRLFLRRFP